MRDHRADATLLRLPLEAVAPSPRPEPLRARAVGLGVAVLAALFGLWLLPTMVPFVVCAAAGVTMIIVGAWRQSLRKRSVPEPQGWVLLDAGGMARTDESGSAALMRWDEPFGLTILANPARTRMQLAFTTPKQTRFLGVRIDVGERGDALSALETLLARAVTVTDSDLQPDGRAPLGATDAARLVRAVAARAPAALERLYLSDSRGDGIVLDAGTLRVGDHELDLTAPLEWRGLVFHEPGTNVATTYQGTWVRQGGVEIVLVSPMPEELSASRSARESSMPRVLTREGRIMQAVADAPPPRELRVAVERRFMLPLRHVLDRAPRVSRVGAPSPDGPHAVPT